MYFGISKASQRLSLWKTSQQAVSPSGNVDLHAASAASLEAEMRRMNEALDLRKADVLKKAEQALVCQLFRKHLTIC